MRRRARSWPSTRPSTACRSPGPDGLSTTQTAGGRAKSDLLLQIVSDVTGLEQELPAQTIGAAFGDAFLAGLASGLLSPSDLRSHWVRIARRFAPDPARHALYQEYYRIYRDLYVHTQDDVHALARLV